MLLPLIFSFLVVFCRFVSPQLILVEASPESHRSPFLHQPQLPNISVGWFVGTHVGIMVGFVDGTADGNDEGISVG